MANLWRCVWLGRERKRPGLPSSRTTTPARTNRGKPLECFGETCLRLGNRIRRLSEIKKLTYTSSSFCPLVTRVCYGEWPLKVTTVFCATSNELVLFNLCVRITVWQMALQVGTIFLSLSYIYVLFLFPGKKWGAISGRITCGVASGFRTHTYFSVYRQKSVCGLIVSVRAGLNVDEITPRKKCGMWTYEFCFFFFFAVKLKAWLTSASQALVRG
jgi:hypothetical protein